MIPTQLHMKGDSGEYDKHHEGDDFLYHFELHQSERTAVAFKTHAVRRYLQAVLEESDAPRKQDNKNQRCGVREEARLLQFEMAVPCQGHEDIGGQQQ